MKAFIKFLVFLVSLTCSMTVDAFDFDGISYNVLSESDKTVCVARQTATDLLAGDVSIPSTISYGGRSYTVTEISGWAFSSCSMMTSVAIPATIQRIGYSAFYGCYGLQAVYIEDVAAWCAVNQGKGFEGNPLSLAHHLYVNGEEVTELVIPEGVTSIGDDAFHDATALKSVVMPSTVRSIGADAFAGCSSIATLSLASGLQNIGDGAFSGCSRLQVVTVPVGTECLGDGAFYHCPALTNIELPQSLKTIGHFAFEGCSSLTNIRIPDQVTKLGNKVFYECEKLSSVKLPDNITEIGDWAFTRCNQLKDISIPSGLKRLGEYAFYWCSAIESLDLPASLTDIGNNALSGLRGLKHISVANSNPNYCCEDGVLFDYDKTTLMLFPAQSDKIQYNIPSTVTTVTPAAFSGSKLKAITLPQTLTRIGNSMLSGLSQLESIDIPATITEIGSSAFSGCTSLKSVNIPDNVQAIGTAAFSGDSSLVKVHLPERLTRIEGWTFDGCSKLSEVTIPDGVTYIGMAAFRDCCSLPAFQIPQGVITIDGYAFEGCTTPDRLIIPDRVEKVGWDAFRGCCGLEELTIGRSVKELAGGTFHWCDNIHDVWSYIAEPFDVNDLEDVHGDVVLLGKCFPDAVTSRATLHVPEGTTEKYLSKRGWWLFTNIVEMDTNAIAPIPNDASDKTSTAFDLQGLRLTTPPTKGIYIQNGRKMVIK